jgi:hypothetical protein
LKKYVLSKKRAEFRKKLSPETKIYYDNLMRMNKLKIRKKILRRYKAGNLQEALYKASWRTYWRKYWKERRRKDKQARQGLLALVIFYVLTILICWLCSL